MSERATERLTEAEWEQRRASRECSTYGHDWQIVSTLAGPVSLVCARGCGDPGYAVVRTPPGRPGCLMVPECAADCRAPVLCSHGERA